MSSTPPEPEDEAAALAELLARCYGRGAGTRELEAWGERIRGGMTARAFVRQLARSPGFTAHRVVRTRIPVGDAMSPVVDPTQVVEYVARARTAGLADIAGIDFNLAGMEAFWHAHADFIAATPFSDTPDGMHRYSFTGGPYLHGDATILRAMIGAHRPRRIVEVGAGYSTACILDVADEIGLAGLAITCIEPNPARLKSLLRPEDFDRVRLIEQPLQGQDLALFTVLEAGDILFIDSSHVLKTGSDVHYALFHILPVLQPGVLVHFHDCRWPFEYRDVQIFEKNYSWNESYAVRALLMYSTRFKVEFYGSLFGAERAELVEGVFPAFMRNTGSGLWVRVVEH